VSDEHVEVDVPPVGEQIHVPAPTWLPVLVAVGVTLALIGVTLGKAITVVGLVIAIPLIIRWIRSTREDIGNLPPGH
jgi:hypothetical protein